MEEGAEEAVVILGGMSLAEFTRKWPPNLRSLFAGLARNALSAHPEDVPASGFLVFLRFYTLMRRDPWRFDYLPGTGGECIAEPLADTARRLGASIRLGVRAERLERRGDGWRACCRDSASGADELIDAREVILALDAPATARLLHESPATAPLAERLRFPAGVQPRSSGCGSPGSRARWRNRASLPATSWWTISSGSTGSSRPTARGARRPAAARSRCTSTGRRR